MTAAETIAVLRDANPPAGPPDPVQDQAATNGHSSPMSDQIDQIPPPKLAARLPRNGRPWKKKGIEQLTQAAEIQRFTYDAIISLKKQLTNEDGTLTLTREDAAAIAQLGKTWDTARDAVRILRGKGLPAAVRSKASKPSAAAALTETEPGKPG